MRSSLYIMITVTVLAVSACVDDYTDANPPQRLDAPTLRVSTPNTANNVLISNPVNAFQAQPEVFMTYGEPLEFTVAVIDAPGGISGIMVTSSIPEYGTITIDDASVAAVQGLQAGTFNFTFTPASDFGDATDRSFNIDVTVSDSQVDERGTARPKSTALTIPVTLGKCLASALKPGYYTLAEFNGQEDGGASITMDSLYKYLGQRVSVLITSIRPGLYEIDDITGGVWPVYYSGRALPTVQVDLCGQTLSGHDGGTTTSPGTEAARTFTVTGTAHDDGSISIEWSYERDDGATPANPASAGYRLTPL